MRLAHLCASVALVVLGDRAAARDLTGAMSCGPLLTASSSSQAGAGFTMPVRVTIDATSVSLERVWPLGEEHLRGTMRGGGVAVEGNGWLARSPTKPWKTTARLDPTRDGFTGSAVIADPASGTKYRDCSIRLADVASPSPTQIEGKAAVRPLPGETPSTATRGSSGSAPNDVNRRDLLTAAMIDDEATAIRETVKLSLSRFVPHPRPDARRYYQCANGLPDWTVAATTELVAGLVESGTPAHRRDSDVPVRPRSHDAQFANWMAGISASCDPAVVVDLKSGLAALATALQPVKGMRQERRESIARKQAADQLALDEKKKAADAEVARVQAAAAQAKAKAEQERTAALRAQQQSRDAAIAERHRALDSHQVQVQSIDDAAYAVRAEDATGVIVSPLLSTDNKTWYSGAGLVREERDGVICLSLGSTNFYVATGPNTVYLQGSKERLRQGQMMRFVGLYLGAPRGSAGFNARYVSD